MLTVEQAVEILNNKSYKLPPFITKWRQNYYGMSLHISGACPSFKSLATGRTRQQQSIQFKGMIYPPGYCGLPYQDIFASYLLTQHPREPDDIFNYRLSQYKPYTREPIRRCIDVFKSAIFQDSSYSINIEDKADSDYINGDNFNGMDLVSYLKSNIDWIVEDPNGVFITIPKAAYNETDTEKIEPEVFFIPTKNIIQLSKDEIIFIISDSAWLVNNQDYFKLEKDSKGKYIAPDKTTGGYYSHQLGRIPHIVAGGVWNTQGWFESWLISCKAIADDFVGVKSGGQLLNKEAVHPMIVEVESECPDCDKSGFNLERCDISEDNPMGVIKTACPTCGGTHSISHNPGQRIIAPAKDMGTNLVQIHQFDMAANKFTSEEIDKLYNRMLSALHLNYIDEAQSGTAKDKDMETRYQFIQNISNDLFGRILYGLITNILSLRNVKVTGDGTTTPAPTKFEINKPMQFQIKTASQLLDDYKSAGESKMPDWVKAKCLEDYVDKQFGGSDVMKCKASLVNQMDILSCANEADKETRMLGGAITNRQWQFSVNLPSILDSLIRLHGQEWLCNTDYDTIKTNVDTIFALIPEIAIVDKANTSAVRQSE